MRVNYDKLGVHREKNLKVDYARLDQIPLNTREKGSLKAVDGLSALGLYKIPEDEPTYKELLVKNFNTILEELSSWRFRLPRPNLRRVPKWGYGVAAACLCGMLALGTLGPPGRTARGDPTIGSVATAENESSYIGSENVAEVSVGRLVKMDGNTAEIFEEAVANEIGESPLLTDSGAVVSVLPTDELKTYFEQPTEETGSGLMDMFGEIPADLQADSDEVLDEQIPNDEQVSYEEQAPDEEQEFGNGQESGNEELSGDEGAVSDPEMSGEEQEPEEEEPEIVMASVKTQLNVRTEPSADAEIAGVLYADCGGTVLEQEDGWTKIESGNLVGWASDEFLVSGDEAVTLMEETGHEVTMVDATSLRVRTEPNINSDVLGHLSMGEEIDITPIEEETEKSDETDEPAAQDDEHLEWAEIEFNGKTAYICVDYTTVKMQYNTGDTVEEMKEKAEEKAKAAAEASVKKVSTNEAELTVADGYDGSASDLEMLATIIYCEAGNQPYEGKVAVGNVVLNRVRSDRFPNDINSVLRAAHQFQPVGNGKYDRMLNSGRVPESCYEAAQDAMNGIYFVGDCLYFKNPKIAGAHAGITIQDHVFW